MSGKLRWAVCCLLAAIGMFLLPAVALADNCGSLSDCWGTAGAAAGAAAGAGAVGGMAGGAGTGTDEDEEAPPPEEEEPDPCAGERSGVQRAESMVDMYNSQIQILSKQLDGMKGPADQLIAELQALAPQAQSEVSWNMVQTLITKLLEAVVAAGPAGPALESLQTMADPTGAIPGSDLVGFFNDLNGYFGVLAGDMDAVADLADSQGLPITKQFVDKMRELEGIKNQAAPIANRINHIRDDQLADAQRKLDDARRQLADCQAAHPS